jgi:proteic killer suppression protein
MASTGETEKLFRRENSRAVPPDLRRAALRKLVQLHAADSLDELRVPPGNRLEALRGDRNGAEALYRTLRRRSSRASSGARRAPCRRSGSAR